MLQLDLIHTIKSELGAEGLSREDIIRECNFSEKLQKKYLVKIGGCEARSDINFLNNIDIINIVCPMIETSFAMQKFIENSNVGKFQNLGITIQTKTAVANLGEILDSAIQLSSLYIDRTDLSKSLGIRDVDCPDMLEICAQIAKDAHGRNIQVTLGGSISEKTREQIKLQPKLFKHINNVETSKAIFSLKLFLEDPETLSQASALENTLLSKRIKSSLNTLAICYDRQDQVGDRNNG